MVQLLVNLLPVPLRYLVFNHERLYVGMENIGACEETGNRYAISYKTRQSLHNDQGNLIPTFQVHC